MTFTPCSHIRTSTVHSVVFGAIILTSILCVNAFDIDYAIYEEQPPGLEVGDLISDLSLNSLLSRDFQFFSPTSVNDTFLSLNAMDGVLSTRKTVDREEMCPGIETCIHEVIIQFETRGIRFVKVRVEVLDLNDHTPTFQQDVIWLDIAETASVGSRFPQGGSLFAEDPDTGDNAVKSYELFNTYSDTFGLHTYFSPLEGVEVTEIVVLTPLDREQISFYELELIAKDFGTPSRSGSALINISLIDANDHSPVFQNTSYSTEIKENQAPGVELVDINATDLDHGENSRIAYSFSRRTPTRLLNLFSIDPVSGKVTTLQALDYETDQTFQIVVQAIDMGLSPIPAYATLFINVKDENDNFPQINFNSDNGNGDGAVISESVPIGEEIVYVSVYDRDTNENGEVHLMLTGSSHFKLEEIYPYELYKLVTDTVLDRETIPVYNLTIIATDVGLQRKTTVRHFLITLLDENDNRPLFTEETYEERIPENNEAGGVVAIVTAIDPDLGRRGEIEYILLNLQHVFEIDSSLGEITAKGVLDGEGVVRYDIIVSACDGGRPKLCSDATVELHVIDENDNAPMFSQSIYYFSIFENVEKGSPVGRVTATDQDSGENGKLSYYEENPKFRIDIDTGEIFSDVIFDYEEETFCSMVVMVADHGHESKMDSVTVNIDILDVNDNPPVISFPKKDNNVVIVALAAKPGLAVTAIQADDADEDDNGQLQYNIQHGNSLGIFQISKTTGEIYTVKELQSIWEGLHQLTINVSDKGLEPRSDTTKVNIIISDLPVNLSFIDFADFVNLTEGLPMNEKSTAFTATLAGIFVLALAAFVCLLVIIAVVAVICCRSNEKAIRTYSFRREENLFSASKSTSRTVTPQNVSSTVEAYLAMQQSPDLTCGTPGVLHSGTFDSQSGVGSSVTLQNLFNDNSECRANHCSQSSMPISETDREVDNLLSTLTANPDQRDETASNDSGRGESDRDAREHASSASTPGGLRNTPNEDQIDGENEEDRSYMASPQCTIECKTLGHSDQCWMPPKQYDPHYNNSNKDLHQSYTDNSNDMGMASPTYSDSDSSPEFDNSVQWPQASFTSFGYDQPQNSQPRPNNQNFDRQGSARLRHHLIGEPLTPISEHPAESLTDLLEGPAFEKRNGGLNEQTNFGMTKSYDSQFDSLGGDTLSCGSGNSDTTPPKVVLSDNVSGEPHKNMHRHSPRPNSDVSITLTESSASEGEFEITPEFYSRKDINAILRDTRETMITDDDACDAEQLCKHIDVLFFSDSTV
ncbi:protocadherin-1-like [Glandiceps talaboti]